MYDKNNAAVSHPSLTLTCPCGTPSPAIAGEGNREGSVCLPIKGREEEGIAQNLIYNARQNMENSESELIIACQKGELENFGQLYDQYIDKIYRFIYYRTRHKETAEDLTAQTFQKALEGVCGYNAGRGRFSSWLYQIARN
ncbi:MAG: sigma factor [Patescibacteria group bacterium]